MINKIQAIRPKARISARTIKYQRLPAGFRWEEARAASWTAVTTGDGAGGIGLKTGEGCAAGLGHGLSSKGMRVSPAGRTFFFFFFLVFFFFFFCFFFFFFFFFFIFFFFFFFFFFFYFKKKKLKKKKKKKQP